MANERNVITILVQAIDRASKTFETTRDRLKELERAETEAAKSADKLDTSQKKLVRTKQEHARTTERLIRTSRDAAEEDRKHAERQERVTRALLGAEDAAGDFRTQLEALRKAHEANADATRRDSDQQLTFFDRIRVNNKLLGEQGKLLRDLEGRDIGSRDPFGRRFGQRGFGVDRDFGIDVQGPRFAGGGFLSSERDLPDPNQLSLFADNLRRVDRESVRTERSMSLMERAAQRLGRRLGEGAFALRRMGEESNRTRRSLADFTRLDETLELGLRRLLRLIATIAPLLPFLAVGLGLVTGAVTALAGGVTALVAALGTLGGALAALPGLLAATAGAVLAFRATVGTGITDIIDRFKEVVQLEESTRKQTTENARAERDAAQALADTRLQNAEQIADIDRRIRQQRQQGNEEVADQERDLQRLRRDNAQEEQDLVRDLRRARRDAANDAAEAERRYRDLVERNRLDEREIAQELSVRRAQLGALRLQGAPGAEIGAAEAGVFATERDLLKEQQDNRAQEARARKTADDQRLQNARQIADIERRLARTRRDNAEEEADAERRLARTRRDNARQLVDLERQRQRLIAQGLRQERDAVERLNDVRAKGTVDLEDTLQGLDPQQRRIVLALRRIRDEWLRLTAATRSRGLALFERALGFLEQHLPQIASQVNAVANAVTGVAERAFARFTAPDRWAVFNRILNDTVGNTTAIGDGLIDLADAFLTITDAARPLVRFISQGFRDIAGSFRESIEGAERSGGLQRFFDATRRTLELTVDILGNLGDALLDVLKIAEPFGEELLGDLVEWTEKLSDWTSSPEGQKAIESFFRDSMPVVRALANLVEELVASFFRVGRALISPDLKTGVSFLETVIDLMADALPKVEQLLIQSTLQNGPVLLEFLRQFGHILGLLVGPNGALVLLLQIATEVLRAFNFLPDPVEKLILTYLALNRILISVSRAFRAIVASMIGFGIQARAVRSSGGFLALFGGPGLAKFIIITLIAFPGLINNITDALRALDRFLSPVTDQVRRLGEAFGVSGDNAETFAFNLLFLSLMFRRLSITALVGGLATLVTRFRTLIRLFQAGGLVAVLATLEERFRRIGPLISRFVGLMQRIGPAAGRLGFVIGGVTLALDGLHFVASKIDDVFGTNLRSIFLSTRQTLAGWKDAWVQAIGDIVRVVDFLAGQIRERWPILLAGALRGIPGAVLAAIGPALFNFGRDIVTGIWNGIRDALPGLGDLIGAALSRILPNIDVPGFSPPKEAAAHAIGEPIGQGIKEGAMRELNTFGDELGDQLQQQLSNAENLAATAEDDAVRGLAGRIAANAQFMIDALETADRTLDDFVSNVESLESSVPSFLRASLSQGDVPARRELARLDRQEVLRDRAQRRRDANNELREAQQQQRAREQSLQTAVARLARLRARLAGGGRTANVTAGRDIFSAATPLTPQQRQQLRRDIAAQQQVVAERRRELEEAERQVREVSQRRVETLRQVALEERRERLEQLAITQEAEREKEIQAAERRAAASIQKFVEGVESGKIKMKDARRELVKALLGAGLTEEQISAWFKAGNKAGNDFQSGLITSLSDVARSLPKALNAAVTKARIAAQIQAPVVIVADMKTLRQAIYGGTGTRVGVGSTSSPDGRPPRGAAGLKVPGGEGAAVPILAHAGEWVLNRSQQWQAALMAGMDRSKLERALFHKLSTKPTYSFALGGPVPSMGTTGGGTTFLTPISINTASPTVDAEYLSRALENRIRQVI